MALYCTRCGTGLPDTARFCSTCGNAVLGAVMPRPTVRPRVGRMIAGVCIGLAQAYGWDVVTVRILTVIAFFCSAGLVSVAYVACWVGIPDEAYPPMQGAVPPQAPPQAPPQNV